MEYFGVKFKLDNVIDFDKYKEYFYQIDSSYYMRFTQYKDTGFNNIFENDRGIIFNVYVDPYNDEPTLYVDTEEVRDHYGNYPSVYKVNVNAGNIEVDDIKNYIEKLKYATKVLNAIKEFFSNSVHKLEFEKRKELKH